MTKFQKLAFRAEDTQEFGYSIEKYAQPVAAETSRGEEGAEADKAVVMSYYRHGSAGAVRLNLRWKSLHQVSDFNFDAAGDVREFQTETEHTGWVILQPRCNFSLKHLLVGGAFSFTGLYCGTKFPLAVTASHGEPVYRQYWIRFWRVVRQALVRLDH
jgi:hypothetical protein